MLENEPIAGATGPDGETTEDQSGSAVRSTSARRRGAASRPAGPPPEEAERAAGLIDGDEHPPGEDADGPGAAQESGQALGATPPAATAAEEVSEDAGVVTEEAAPKRATRRRAVTTTTRRSRTKKSEPVAEEATGDAADEPGAGDASPVEPRDESQDVEASAPVRRRRTRKKTEEAEQGAQEPQASAASAGAPVPADGAAEPTAQAADAPGLVAPSTSAGAEAPATPAAPAAESAATGDRLELSEEELAALAEDEPVDEPGGEDIIEDALDDDRRSPLADPFGLTVRERLERPSAPAPAFPAPAAVFTPLFQAPEPRAAKAVISVPAAPQVPASPAEDEEEEDGTIAESEQEQEEESGRRRRRRRGGRGRGKGRERDEADEADEAEEADDEARAEREESADETQAAAADTEGEGTTRRRRRRRRRGADEAAEPTPDDPPNTVVRIRAPRAGRTSVDEVQSVRGSTRLEAKKQRRREGRELGRRRPPIITESEFLARRESVERVMVVRRTGGRTQIAVIEDGVLVEHYVDREAGQSYVGNVYLGKVQNVLPSMEAAFVDIGKGRNAVLYAGEVNFDTAGLEGQPKRIESALKSGQSVLVQVTKDPIGHKGARLTSQISLPGRYLVYVPDGSMTGISRKLPDKERTRLKTILKKVMPENAGVIVRTAAEGASEEELGRDVSRLSAQWDNIRRKAKSASPPELLSSEPDMTIRVVRDVFNEDFSSLVVAGDEAWATVDEYVRYVAPHLVDRLQRWDEDGDVFAAYRIDEQIAKALERKVWLPSGGSLVIDRTEAMIVIDVNTGKFTGQGGNLEETVTRNNLEAAEEIVRQLRLRDIGGIIVIDFIDMVLESNRDLVLRRLLECLARDRTKHQVAEVTSLGLVQMTRKRVGQGLIEAFSTPCECCNGRGLHLSTEPVEGKPEPRGTQGKMAIEKAVAGKLGGGTRNGAKNGDGSAVAAGDQASRDSVTDALDDGSGGDDQPVDDAEQTSGRGRRRSRRARAT